MILTIDTATAACSAALLDGDAVHHAARETVGRGHAERLVPMIEALLAEAGGTRPEAIIVDCGPGSFTGVRVGLAAAIGLGLGWGVPVHGCSSRPLIAAACFAEHPALDACAVALTGGHGELFVQSFAVRPFAETSPLASLPPADAAALVSETVVIGSGAAPLVEARGWGEAIEQLPDAAAMRWLPEAFRNLEAKPIYGRPPDAKPIAA
jgi:tRNA threonylcarbamoyladenosine biosynthesis protein TsaB